MKYRVLIGDDDKRIRNYLTRVLSEAGYDVVSSSTPEGVLQRIDYADLLVTDQNYGREKMNGIEISKKVRGSSIKNLPVILASSEITPKMNKICNELKVTGLEKNIMDEGFKDKFLEAVKNSLNI